MVTSPTMAEPFDDEHEPLHQEVDAASRARAAAALDAVAARQAHLPQCALCGQRSIRLDPYGLCSKTSASHQQYRTQRTGALW